MSRRLKISPTKSALLALRRQIAFLHQGHELLERKRELLTRLVYDRLGQYRALRNEARESLEDAYRWLAITHMRMGGRNMRQAGLGLEPSVHIRILPRSSLGVEFPSVSAEELAIKPVGLMWTDPSFDETRQRLRGAAVKLARLAESETALWRLLKEQRKTQKRVNALKYNVIPRYEETVRYVQGVLEEDERNTLFQIQLLSERAEQAGTG
jgi:V/A-type H+-transporting ATPase subunit D